MVDSYWRKYGKLVDTYTVTCNNNFYSSFSLNGPHHITKNAKLSYKGKFFLFRGHFTVKMNSFKSVITELPCKSKCHAEVDLHEGHAFETGSNEGPPTNVFDLVCLLGIRGSWQQ